MSRNFDRQYRLVVTRSGVTSQFTRERINFRIQKFAGGINNAGTINMYNLPESERNRFARPVPNIDTVIVEPRISVFLYAGYGTDLALAGRGVAKQAFSIKERADWITTFEFFTTLEQDANIQYQKDYINTPAITIMRDLFTQWLYPDFRITPNALARLQEVQTAYVVNGPVKRSITTLLNDFDVSFTVDEAGAKVAVAGETIDPPGFTLPLISQDTGLIGAPTINLTGVNVKAQLSSQIVGLYPMQSFILESETTRQTFQRASENFVDSPSNLYRQTFNVTETELVGDNRSGEWAAEITGVFQNLVYQGVDTTAQPRAVIQ